MKLHGETKWFVRTVPSGDIVNVDGLFAVMSFLFRLRRHQCNVRCDAAPKRGSFIVVSH